MGRQCFKCMGQIRLLEWITYASGPEEHINSVFYEQHNRPLPWHSSYNRSQTLQTKRKCYAKFLCNVNAC